MRLVPLAGQTRALLREWMAAQNQPAFRADQVLAGLHTRHEAGWEGLRELPAVLRDLMRQHFAFSTLSLARQQGSQDSTRKFLWRMADGALIESVLIPASPALYGEGSDRHTLCVSTQVGCAYGCRFCASGLEGWKRHLEPSEIVEQVLAVERLHRSEHPRSERRLINNLVIMGMGEPLANYVNLMAALEVLNAAWGGNIGARKITISTSGLVPQIRMLADQPWQFRLALSLHGATDVVRSRIMPINRKYPLAELVEAAAYYQTRKKGMITLEYILMAGVNDMPDQVAPLARIAQRLRAKVNLIPYNTVEGLTWQRPAPDISRRFHQLLLKEGVAATLRHEKGHDIDAACGQLRLRAEKEIAAALS